MAGGRQWRRTFMAPESQAKPIPRRFHEIVSDRAYRTPMRAGRIRAAWTYGPLGIALAAMAPGSARAESPPPVIIHYLGDLITDASGGREQGTALISRLDLVLSSGDRLFGIDGMHAQADVMALHGGGFSARRSGDRQVASNIDAPYAVRPYEAWVEAQLGARGHMKAGLVDLNGEFDTQSVGAYFLNSSFGIGPDISQSGPNGPSIFPVTAPGLVMAYQPPGATAKLGIFDARAGDPDHQHRAFPDSFGHDGVLLIGEGHVQIGPLVAVQAGAWTYTDRMPRIDGAGRGTSAGGYALVEARLLDGKDDRALRVWLRAGEAADTVNPVATYVGGGVTWGNSQANYGLAVAHARQGDPARHATLYDGHPGNRAETAIEATGRWRVLRGLSVQPDAQYIVHPGWDPNWHNALVLALRLDWTWLIGG
jgi:porin